MNFSIKDVFHFVVDEIRDSVRQAFQTHKDRRNMIQSLATVLQMFVKNDVTYRGEHKDGLPHGKGMMVLKRMGAIYSYEGESDQTGLGPNSSHLKHTSIQQVNSKTD